MPSNKVELALEDGMRIAHRFLEIAEPIVGIKAFEIAGSIRRLRPVVHDVDIVFKPIVTEQPSRVQELRAFCDRAPNVEVHNMPFDLYFSTPETFQTLLLIRTGSKENNIRLCQLAQRKGWKLSPDGLFNASGRRVRWHCASGTSELQTEHDIYDALGVPWQEPWEREVKR